MTKYRFQPAPEVSHNTLVPPSDLAVYESSVGQGVVTVVLSREGAIQAGTRLTYEQASALARALVSLLGEDDDPHTLGYDAGYATGYKEGERNGFNEGWDDGYGEGNSEGWDEGYALGLERGAEGAA